MEDKRKEQIETESRVPSLAGGKKRQILEWGVEDRARQCRAMQNREGRLGQVRTKQSRAEVRQDLAEGRVDR